VPDAVAPPPPQARLTNIFRTESTVVNLDPSPKRLLTLKVTEIALRTYKKLGLASSKRRSSRFSDPGADPSAYHPRPQVSKSAIEKIEKPAARPWFWWRRGAGNG